MTLTRKIWIDIVRGFCILAILLHHTEMYFVGEAVTDYRPYVDNALCTFYFMDGKSRYCLLFPLWRSAIITINIGRNRSYNL